MPTFRAEPLEERCVPSARLQVINGTPPLTGIRQAVDVYVDGVKVADDLAPGAGTPFLTVPSDVQIQIDVVNAFATDLSDPYGTLKVALADGTAHVAVADRFSGPLDLTAIAREAGIDPAGVNTDLLVFNGMSGLPKADVRIHGLGTVANDLPFGSSTKGYLSLPPAEYTVDVFRADGAIRVATFSLDLSEGAGGKAAVLTLGGSLVPVSFRYPGVPSATAVFPDGTAIGMPFAALLVARPTFAVGVPGHAGLLNQAGGVVEDRPVGRTAGTSVVAADTNGDGIADLVSTDPAGGPSVVRLGVPDRTVSPFEVSFTGGVFLAAGDFDDDGYDDVVVTPDQGGAGRVRVFSGRTLDTLADFFGIDDPNFRGGARPAVGDVNGDGTPDLIVAAGFGGGPRIAVYDGKDLAPGRTPAKLVGDFFAFEDTLRNGAFAAAGDVNGDGVADVVLGGGPGGGPRVLALSGADLTQTGDRVPVANFFAGDPAGRIGVRVAAHYVNDDRRAEVFAGLGTGTDPQVRVFLGANLVLDGTPPADTEYTPFPGVGGGVFVG